MILIFNTNGDLLNSQFEKIYQGSNGANNIYFLAPFSATNEVTVIYSLPNGETTGETLMKVDGELEEVKDSNGKSYTVWSAKINKVVTAIYGEVVAQFKIITPTQVISTKSISFYVERGIMPDLPLDESNKKSIEAILQTMQNVLQSLPNLKNGAVEGSLEQVSFKDDAKNPKAKGLGAIALGGFRGDKPNNQPDEDDTTTTAKGIQSIAFGAGCHANGNWSLAGGKDNKAYGRQSVALGGASVAGRENAPANEFLSSFAMGDSVKSTGRCSFAFGQGNEVSGKNACSFGLSNITSGAESFVTGSYNHATGTCAFISGESNNILSKYSATFGYKNNIEHDRAFLIGHDLLSSAPSDSPNSDSHMPQIVVGRWNDPERTNDLFTVGAGYGYDKWQDGSYKYADWQQRFNPFAVGTFGARVRGILTIEGGMEVPSAIRLKSGTKGRDEQVETINIDAKSASISLTGNNANIKINGNKVVLDTELELLKEEIIALKNRIATLENK
ncbi:MAG: hypothetical protein IKW33_02195 [Clostridia bacterium]|nr:hypothetical protein [Clostridia bacterium]